MIGKTGKNERNVRSNMKNPLNKRLIRELKSDAGKYAVIFLFMIMLISLVSGFLVADNSVYASYTEGFEKYNVEDGHVCFNLPLEEEIKKEIEEKGKINLFELFYCEEEIKEKESGIRIYKIEDRENIDKICIMSGEMAKADNEIVLDRLYAINNGIEIGDDIFIKEKAFTVTGYVAYVDYSCLFENNTDMMFDAKRFCVGAVTTKGFARINSTREYNNYAWKYKEAYADEKEEKELSDALLENAAEVIEEYDEKIYMEQMMAKGSVEEGELLMVSDYLPKHSNQAINFTGDDMGSDKAMFTMFNYLVVALLAFIFAVTTNNTITKEASVIGTLRASGYSKGEMIRHYLVLPVLVTIIAAVIGNILGYTIMKDFFVEIYFSMYSLATYVTLWNADAFFSTTVVPIIIMFVINFLIISGKMQISPLRFIRRELSKRSKKKAIRLNTKIPIMRRFRLRILFQNLPNYFVMFVGIIMAGAIIVFGLMFADLIPDFAAGVKESMIADYQYILKKQVETENPAAEKYSVAGLEIEKEGYLVDEITIYGIEENSRFVSLDFKPGKVYISNGMAKKYGFSQGQTFSLRDKYENKEYEFEIGGIYQYDAALAVFMPRGENNEKFGKEQDYFTGYFSNELLTDIEDENIVKIITEDDYTKVSRQLEDSFGEMLVMFQYFGVAMFVLVVYILSKQIIEKNTQSISMTKILGFKNGEIGSLYILATSIVVVFSLLLSIPLIDAILRWAFENYIYTMVTGYIPYIVSKSVFVNMFLWGIGSYVVVSALQLIKISKISKSEALKSVE